MSITTGRRRALVTALAVATAAGLALAGVGSAEAATPLARTAVPAGAAAAPSPLGAGGAPTRAAGRPASSPPAAPAGRAGSALLTPKAVFGSRNSIADPQEVNSYANPNQTVPQAVVGDTLYGIGYVASKKVSDVESWTDSGWKRLASGVSETSYQATSFDGGLYFMSWNPSTKKSTLWKYDGSTSTSVQTFTGFTNLFVAGDHLALIRDAGTKTVFYSVAADGTRAAGASTTKNLSGFVTLGDTSYVWVVGSGYNAALYRVDPTILTRVVASPYAQGGVEYDGAVYFGGSDGITSHLFRFDGAKVSEVTDVETGQGSADFSQAYWIPSVSVVDGQLFFSVDYQDYYTHFYSYDGTTLTFEGTIAESGRYFLDMVEFQGSVFLGAGDGKGHDWTWVYEKSSTTTETLASSVPTLTGAGRVGTTLAVHPGAWTPVTTFVYVWHRGSDVLTGADGPTHELVAADRGHVISVTLEGSAYGYTSAQQTSAPTAKTAYGTITLNPAISGTMKAGTTVSTLTQGPVPTTAKLAYRWYRDGKPLAGATARTHKVTSGDIGHRLQVAVHATASGYTDASAKSAARTAKR